VAKQVRSEPPATENHGKKVRQKDVDPKAALPQDKEFQGKGIEKK